MAEKEPQMQATLGLTGLTMNAMALIAPGAGTSYYFVDGASPGTGRRRLHQIPRSGRQTVRYQIRQENEL